MPLEIFTPDGDDSGFICKACRRFYADQEVKRWDTKWITVDGDPEPTLAEIIHECPLCGEVRSYHPNESTFRKLAADTP